MTTYDDVLSSLSTRAFHKIGLNCAFNKERCSNKNFNLTLDASASPCFQFNSYNLLNSTSKKQRLWAEGMEMYFDLHPDTAVGTEDAVEGITLYINHRGRPHYKPYAMDVTLQPGTLNHVIIDNLKVDYYFVFVLDVN